MKTLEEFDFNQAPQIPAAKIRELAEGGYIERAEPVVLMGECGTGKTHLATGLCVAACRQKRRVRFTTANHESALLGMDASVSEPGESQQESSRVGFSGMRCNHRKKARPRDCVAYAELQRSVWKIAR